MSAADILDSAVAKRGGRQVLAARALDEAAAAPGGWQLPAPASMAEWRTARLAPRCIVAGYLYADVAALFAPGGTSKTTLILYESVHVALGRRLWGMEVHAPGPVLIVTAEDQREFLLARLREICVALRLSDTETDQVLESVRIDDRTAAPRRLTAIMNDTVHGSGFAEEIVRECVESNFRPSLIVFDPMVSFGVGESRVNDAEQGLIEAARVIVAGLDCCVRYVHHTGKGPANDKRTDQYVGRGGSALSDGCRMVAALRSVDDSEMRKETGEGLAEGQSAFVLERPKVSYAPPQRRPIYVRRSGYGFEQVTPLQRGPDSERPRLIGEQLARFIQAEAVRGMGFTKNTLERLKPDNLSRDDVRLGLSWLEACGRLHQEPIVGADGKPPRAGARTRLRVDPAGREPSARPV